MIWQRTRLKRKLFAVFMAVVLAGMLEAPVLASDSDPPSETGDIALVLQDAETGSYMTGGIISLYRVANIEETGTDVYGYTYTDEFAGMEGQGELNTDTLHAMAVSLSEYVRSHGIPAYATRAPDEKGQVKFEGLGTGLYLIVQTESAEGFEDIDPFLVSIPMDMGNGPVYDIDASPKTEVMVSEAEPHTEAASAEDTGGDASAAISAKTGDNQPIALWVILMTACVGGITIYKTIRTHRAKN